MSLRAKSLTGKRPAGNDIARNPREPIFHLVEPGRLVRRVVEMDLGISREKLLDALGLVGREVVGNEMDLLAAGLIGDDLGEKGDQTLGRCAALQFYPAPHRCAC